MSYSETYSKEIMLQRIHVISVHLFYTTLDAKRCNTKTYEFIEFTMVAHILKLKI